jgi:carboxyl-terminal processing protease
MNELWRKRVKNDWLRLKLAGKDDKNIVDILDKRYDGFRKRLGQIKSADAFQTYMNAYTMAIEPHTNYMGPRAAEDFDISMRLSLVGIGAVLTESDDFPTIRELVPGGPAALSGLLQIGDHIAGVAQGASGAMTDVQGWRLDDAVQLIRGAPDSVVVLDILPADAGPDGIHKLVTLIRKKVSLEQQAAKSSVRSVTDGKVSRRIGVITLPSFYEDFAARQKGAKDYKSATRDVARLLDELKKDKVDGMLIDLRNNGGGSLAEAVELTGLFIGKGPVVQQRDAGGAIAVESDTDPGIAWNGPLGVLINRGSASASEIFAAAIQDYGRGLIIGEPSFGKGTVQTVIDLDRVAKNSKPQFGELKLTVAQFFRINGGTTQLRGVTPDILFPSTSGAEDFGESSFDNALPWTQIKAADYVREGDLKGLLPSLSTLHDARVKKDRAFQYLQEDLALSRLERDKNLVSLNEAERRKERDAQETRLRSREDRKDASAQNASVGGNARPDDGLQPGERNFANELAAEKIRKSAEDFVLNEAVNILGDQMAALKTGDPLAARAKPDSVRVPE